MIRIVTGDILNATEDMIGHQVNCQGVMGAWLAKQIKYKYPFAYSSYLHLCKNTEDKRDLLGRIKQVKEHDDKVIVHIFGQYSYGRGKIQTDYVALKRALKKLEIVARNYDESIALPYGIGCGLAGGDWDIVYKIIDEVFSGYEVTLYKLN